MAELADGGRLARGVKRVGRGSAVQLGVALVQGPGPGQVGGQVASSMAVRLGAARPGQAGGQGRQVLQAVQADQLQDLPWGGGKRLCAAPVVLVPGSVAI